MLQEEHLTLRAELLSSSAGAVHGQGAHTQTGTVTELPALARVLELPVPCTLRIQSSVSLQKVSPSPKIAEKPPLLQL